jgi:hypothetical protein
VGTGSAHKGEEAIWWGIWHNGLSKVIAIYAAQGGLTTKYARWDDIP